MESIDLQYLPIKLGELDAFVFMMKVKDLEFITISRIDTSWEVNEE